MISLDISVWIGAFFTIAVFSYVLYKDNSFFKFTERTIVAVTTGYYFVMGVKNVMSLSITPALQESQWIMIVPLLVGLLLFTRFFKQTERLSRLPVAILIGTSIGVAIVTNLSGKAMKLIVSTMVPLTSLDNIILVVLTISALSYFIFSYKHEGTLGVITKFGRYCLMITFGSYFGNYVMTRLTLVITRMQFLLFDLLGL